jgi:hypothetical protein
VCAQYPHALPPQFNQAHQDLLHTRTADGLPLTLGVSFQYRYIPQHLHTLYLAYKNDHVHVYENTATAVIANVACNYSAYTFFNDKQGIAAVMQQVLATQFQQKLYAQIEALQIKCATSPWSSDPRTSTGLAPDLLTRVPAGALHWGRSYIQLPDTFQNAILESISTKQNITRSSRFKENMQVTFETTLMVASQRKNQTIIEATGVANQRQQQALANAQVTEQQVSAEMYAYGNISAALGLPTASGLDYIWWDSLQALAANGEGKEFLVGVNPQVVLPVEEK